MLLLPAALIALLAAAVVFALGAQLDADGNAGFWKKLKEVLKAFGLPFTILLLVSSLILVVLPVEIARQVIDVPTQQTPYPILALATVHPDPVLTPSPRPREIDRPLVATSTPYSSAPVAGLTPTATASLFTATPPQVINTNTPTDTALPASTATQTLGSPVVLTIPPSIPPTLITRLPPTSVLPTQVPSLTPSPNPVLCSPYARITSPAPGSVIRGDFSIMGSAYLPPEVTDRFFQKYVIWYTAIGDNPGSRELLREETTPVVNASLDSVNIAKDFIGKKLPPGQYEIRLQLVDNTGNYDRPPYPDCVIQVVIEF